MGLLSRACALISLAAPPNNSFKPTRFAGRLNSGVRYALKTSASSRSRTPAIALALVVGLMFVWLGGIEAYRWRLLNGATAETQASVTAARRNPSRKAFGGPPYQLQYQFRAPPSGHTFHYTGQALTIERWVRAPEEIWHSAQAKTLSVRYAQSDPRVIQPVAFALPRPFNAIGFSIFAILSLIAAVVIHRDRGGKSNDSFKPNPLRGSA